MTARRALVLCPGRGSYLRESLGSLQGLHAPSLDVLDRLRAGWGRPTVRELDAAKAFSSRSHLAGENASILTMGATLADLDQLDPDKVQVVCVIGNSMGWYTALAVAGALSLEHGAALVETMGQYQVDNVIGGQIVYPMVDDDWRIDPARLARVEQAVATIPDLFWSIRLGGQAVLGGTEDALAAATAALPPVELADRVFPLRLPLHSAFHTPLMTTTSQRAQGDLGRLGWAAPRLPLVDGHGRVWRPRLSDPDALRRYTLDAQVVEPFDLRLALRTALAEYAPDLIVLPGPGTNLGGAVAQTLIAEGWAGIRSRADFLARQSSDPILAAMRWPGQRELVAR